MQMTKSVKDPGKQRERLFNAPAHVRHKLMSAHLAPDLVKSQGVKSLPVRKGDTVRIVRGDHEGFEGKISTVDRKNYRIFIEGLTREKVDGTVIFVSVHPSKVLVKNLNLDDKWRKASLARKKPLLGKEEAEEKPAKEAVKPAETKPKPAQEKVKPAEVKSKPPVKAKEVAKAKEEAPVKPVVKKAKPVETKAVIPVEVEVEKKPEVVKEKEKPVAKKPRVAKKPVEKAVEAPVEQKPETVPKPARKRVVKEAAPAEEKPAEAKVTEEEKPAEKTAKAPAKRAAPKKTPAKSKPKTEEAAGGA